MLKIAKISGLVLAVVIVLGGGYIAGMIYGWYGELKTPYPAIDAQITEELVASRMAEQRTAGAALGVE